MDTAVRQLIYRNRRCDDESALNLEDLKAITKTSKSDEQLRRLEHKLIQSVQVYTFEDVILKVPEATIVNAVNPGGYGLLKRSALCSETDNNGKCSVSPLFKDAEDKNQYGKTSDSNKKLIDTPLFNLKWEKEYIPNGASIREEAKSARYCDKLLSDMSLLIQEMEVFMKWEWPTVEYDAIECLIRINKTEYQELISLRDRYGSSLKRANKPYVKNEAEFDSYLDVYRYRVGITNYLGDIGVMAALRELFRAHPHYAVLQDKAIWLLQGIRNLFVHIQRVKHYRQLEKLDKPSFFDKVVASFLGILKSIIAIGSGIAAPFTYGASSGIAILSNVGLSYATKKLMADNNNTLRELIDLIPAIYAVVDNYVVARFGNLSFDTESLEIENQCKEILKQMESKAAIKQQMMDLEKVDPKALYKITELALSDPGLNDIIVSAVASEKTNFMKGLPIKKPDSSKK